MDTLWPRILSLNEYLGAFSGNGPLSVGSQRELHPFLSIGENGDIEKYYP